MRECLTILYYALYIYMLFICLNIIVSWIPPLYNSRIFTFLRRVSDFYMRPFHGLLIIGIFDFTPIIGFAIYDFVLNCLVFLIN